MLKLYFIAFLLVGCSAFSFKLKNGDDECCDTKTVGDVTYELVGEMDTSSYGCISNCVYQPMGGNRTSSFCFKRGSLPVACKDDALRTTTTTPTWTTTTGSSPVWKIQKESCEWLVKGTKRTNIVRAFV